MFFDRFDVIERWNQNESLFFDKWIRLETAIFIPLVDNKTVQKVDGNVLRGWIKLLWKCFQWYLYVFCFKDARNNTIIKLISGGRLINERLHRPIARLDWDWFEQ